MLKGRALVDLPRRLVLSYDVAMLLNRAERMPRPPAWEVVQEIASQSRAPTLHSANPKCGGNKREGKHALSPPSSGPSKLSTGPALGAKGRPLQQMRGPFAPRPRPGASEDRRAAPKYRLAPAPRAPPHRPQGHRSINRTTSVAGPPTPAKRCNGENAAPPPRPLDARCGGGHRTARMEPQRCPADASQRRGASRRACALNRGVKRPRRLVERDPRGIDVTGGEGAPTPPQAMLHGRVPRSSGSDASLGIDKRRQRHDLARRSQTTRPGAGRTDHSRDG